MATIRLKSLSTEAMINGNNEPYIQLIGLGEDGGVYSLGPSGKWVPISMEVYVVPPTPGLIEVVQ